MFSNVPVFRCVEHVKRRCKQHVKGGMGHVLKNLIDMSAFIENEFVFHLLWDSILKRLEQESSMNAVVKYLSDWVLYKSEGGLWAAQWRSSTSETRPGFSTFTPNTIERLWKSFDDLHGRKSDHEVASTLFPKLTDTIKMWKNDGKFASLCGWPVGEFKHQPSLLRGKGIMEAKGTVFPKAHRRFTVAAMAERSAHEDFFMHGAMRVRSPRQDAGGPLQSVYVFPRRRDVEFDASEMQYFEGLVFAPTMEAADALMPKLANGLVDIVELRSYLSSYTIVAQRAGMWLEMSSTGQKYGSTEFTKFVEQEADGVNFQILTGSRARAPAAKAAARKQTRAQRARQNALDILEPRVQAVRERNGNLLALEDLWADHDASVDGDAPTSPDAALDMEVASHIAESAFSDDEDPM